MVYSLLWPLNRAMKKADYTLSNIKKRHGRAKYSSIKKHNSCSGN